MSDSLILGIRNPCIQIQAPDFLKRSFVVKWVGNYYYYTSYSKISPGWCGPVD